jgi:hypothetical protein
MHFYINEDDQGEIWNLGMVLVPDGGAPERLLDAQIEPVLTPGTRWPSAAVITARNKRGGSYRVELTAGRRFFLCGLGYTHPEWGHGLNKGPLAVGYDEIATDEITRYAPPHVHAQAFVTARMTLPDGAQMEGVGALESFCIGPHAKFGFKEMFDAS